MKTCIQRGDAPHSASASSVQTEPWLRQNAVPAAVAARAVQRSPSGQKRPDRPVGPTMTGMLSRFPKSSIERSRLAAPFSGCGKSSMSSKADSLRRSVRSSSAAPSAKSNTMRGRRRWARRRISAMLKPRRFRSAVSIAARRSAGRS